MASRLPALAAAAFALCAAGTAEADRSWYASGQLGLALQSSSDIDESSGLVVPGGSEADFDLGFNGALAAGYRWNLFRLEGEFGFSQNDIDQFTIGGADVVGGGDVSAFTFMANAFRDFMLSEAFSVYVGGGAGVASVSLNEITVAGVPVADEDSFAFAYQLGAGLGFEITRSTILTADYRYVSTTDPEFDGPAGTTVDASYTRHDFRIGLRYMF